VPELPEVESLRKLLARTVVGRVIARVEINEARLRRPVGAQLATALPGCTIQAIGRRGKYLLFDLRDDVLLVHLGMSGSLTHRHGLQDAHSIEQASNGASIGDASRLDPRHDHVKFILDDSSALVYNDQRRFGLIKLLHRAELGIAKELKALGPDALDAAFDTAYLALKTRGRRTAIKNLLMDQGVVAGLGNIYAAEALFRAGIRPGRRTATLKSAELSRIVSAIRALLSEAIGAGGTTFRNYLDARGQPGRFGARLMVYARAGEPCYVCSTPIRSRVLGQRSSCYCPCCQR
jgi:formamidopyrimidine-DNA glycosylase